MASREEGKGLRRKAIIDAARQLISGAEATSFSMRALSERAGVSITTPYNLFGSKQSIMQALLDEDIRRFSATMDEAPSNDLERFFDAVAEGARSFAADDHYYRAVMAAVYREGGAQYRSSFGGPRRRFWETLVERAIEGKFLAAQVQTVPFALNLAGIFFSNILEWVAGEIDLEKLEGRTHYGFALALLAMARRPYRSYLRERAMMAQDRLVSAAERPC